MTDNNIKIYSKEWFVEQGPKKQKNVIKALKNTNKYNDVEIEINKYLVTGSVDTVKSLMKNCSETAVFAEQREIIRKIGVNEIVSLLDADSNGEITDEEFLDVAFSDENEFSNKNNAIFTNKDLQKIYENALKSQKGTVEKGKTKDKYTFKDGSTTTISKNKDGSMNFKTEESTINKNEKHTVNYDYNTSVKYETIEDSKGRIRFASVDAPGKLNDKSVSTEYFDSGNKFIETDTIGKTEQVLYNKDGEEISKNISVKYNSNGKIEDTLQQDIGDCWLLSGVNALRVTTEGQKLIQNSIIHNSDGSITVRLKGVNKEYTYSAEQIVLKKYENTNLSYAHGDTDMNLIEMSIGNYRKEMAESSKNPFKNVKKDDPLDGGYQNEAFYYLTGKRPSPSVFGIFQILDLNKKEKNPDMYALTASFKDKDNSFNADIKNKHTYSVCKVTKSYVYVVDPHDSSKEIAYPIDKFKKNCLATSLLDVSKINK